MGGEGKGAFFAFSNRAAIFREDLISLSHPPSSSRETECCIPGRSSKDRLWPGSPFFAPSKDYLSNNGVNFVVTFFGAFVGAVLWALMNSPRSQGSSRHSLLGDETKLMDIDAYLVFMWFR